MRRYDRNNSFARINLASPRSKMGPGERWNRGNLTLEGRSRDTTWPIFETPGPEVSKVLQMKFATSRPSGIRPLSLPVGEIGSGFSGAESSIPSIGKRYRWRGPAIKKSKVANVKKNWISTHGGTWGSGSRLYKNSRETSNLASSGKLDLPYRPISTNKTGNKGRPHPPHCAHRILKRTNPRAACGRTGGQSVEGGEGRRCGSR